MRAVKAAIDAPQVFQYTRAGKPAKTRFSPNSPGARFRGGPHSTGEQDEVQHSCDQQCWIGDMKDAWNAWGRLFSSRLLEKRQLNSNVLDLTLNLSMKSLFNLNSALYMAPRNARLRT